MEIIPILDSTGDVVVEYTYDAWGNHVVTPTDEAYTELSQLNPFRYRGYYYDTETGLYFLKTRYYDPEVGRFITIDDLSYLDPDTINGLNLYAYCGDNPVMRADPNGNAWYDWLLSGLQIVAGVILMATGLGAGFGAMLVAGGAIGMISNALGSTIGGGLSSMLNGWGAISTGISLLAFGPLGVIAGIGMMAIGGATMIMGANEVVSGITGTNYLRDWMGSKLYDGLYMGLNIASTVGTVVGRVGMRLAGTTYERSTQMKGKPYGRNIHNDNRYYYDSHGRPSWSHHNMNQPITGEPSGQHWHMSWGRDNEHIYNFLEIIKRLILGD